MAVAEGLGVPTAPASEASATLKPPASVKFFYCFGQMIESGYLTANTFVFFYYTAVLGVPGSLVGLAVAISMTLDAMADPLIGSWSDSLRTRFGRRLPVMLIGAPLTLLTMALLFSPPTGLSVFGLFLWLTFAKMGFRGFASMYNIPYFALGGEMSSDYVERSKIVAYRLFAGILASVTVTAFAYSVFFAGEGGLQRPERYPAFGLTIGTIMLVAGLICCAGVWRFAASLPQPLTPPGALHKRLMSELAEIFRNRSFRILFISLLIFTSAAGAHQALQNHVYVFVWKLRPETMQILSYVYLFGILVATPLTPFFMRFIEKKTAAMIGFWLVVAAFLAVPGARALGLFAPVGEDALVWLIPTNLVVGFGSGMLFIAYPSMIADAAEEHEYMFGTRREGLFFSGLGFAGKAAAGMGAMVGGFALDLLHFPREVGRQVNAVIDESILRSLVVGWSPVPALMCVGGAVIFFTYAISRARHDEIVVALKAKRALEVSEGRSS